MIRKVKKFELIILDEDGEKRVEFVDFSDFDKGFSLWNSPEELFDARKLKWPELYENDTLLAEESTMVVEEGSDEME